jgi:hypothetical protein
MESSGPLWQLVDQVRSSAPSGSFLRTILCGRSLPFACSFAFCADAAATTSAIVNGWPTLDADASRLMAELVLTRF